MNMKVFIWIFILLLSLYGNTSTSENLAKSRISTDMSNISQKATIMNISPYIFQEDMGTSFTLSINILDASNLYGWEYRLSWKSVLLNVTDVMEGSFLKMGGNTFFTFRLNNSGGYMRVDCTLLGDVAGVSGNGTLATVTFYVKNAGECAFDLYETMLLNALEQEIIHQTVDAYGYFVIPSGNLTPVGSHYYPPHIIDK